MRLIRIVILVAVAMAGMTFAGCSSDGTADGTLDGVEERAAPGFMAPGFELENLDGEAISLGSLRGRPVMLNFWATWCGPCRAEMPYIQEIHEDPAWLESGLLILAVNIGESASQARSFVDDFGLTFTVLLDSDEKQAMTYNISHIPTTFFIGKDGIIKDVRVGSFRGKAEIEGYLQELIAE